MDFYVPNDTHIHTTADPDPTELSDDFLVGREFDTPQVSTSLSAEDLQRAIREMPAIGHLIAPGAMMSVEDFQRAIIGDAVRPVEPPTGALADTLRSAMVHLWRTLPDIMTQARGVPQDYHIQYWGIETDGGPNLHTVIISQRVIAALDGIRRLAEHVIGPDYWQPALINWLIEYGAGEMNENGLMDELHHIAQILNERITDVHGYLPGQPQQADPRRTHPDRRVQRAIARANGPRPTAHVADNDLVGHWDSNPYIMGGHPRKSEDPNEKYLQIYHRTAATYRPYRGSGTPSWTARDMADTGKLRPLAFPSPFVSAILSGHKWRTSRPVMDEVITTNDLFWIKESFFKFPYQGENYIMYQADYPEETSIPWLSWGVMEAEDASVLLLVTDVAQRRLQDVTMKGLVGEGFDFSYLGDRAEEPLRYKALKAAYSVYWDDSWWDTEYAWANNPFVWDIGFQVVKVGDRNGVNSGRGNHNAFETDRRD